MTVGQWLGKWVGQWLGSASEQPEGSMRGHASVSVGGSGQLSALAHANGAASVSLHATGTIEVAGDPVPLYGQGVATLTLAGSGNLTDALTPEDQVVEQQAVGSGTGGDAGTGYIRIDRSWVKGLKVAKVGVSWPSTGSVTSRFTTVGVSRRVVAKSSGGTVHSASTGSMKPCRTRAIYGVGVARSDSFCLLKTSKITGLSYNCAYEAIDVDVMLALLEMI